MLLFQQGWMVGVQHRPSPNYDARPNSQDITLLVIHNISLPPNQFNGSAVDQLFMNNLNCAEHPYYEQLRGGKVSAHFFIRRTGTIVQYVSCDQRAWHAGVSSWQGQARCNDFSIGIELEGSDEHSYSPAQYLSLQVLTEQIQTHYPIQHVVGHDMIAPDRKTDPGASFDWIRYRRVISEVV